MIPDRIEGLEPRIGEQDFPAGRQPGEPGQHYEVLVVYDLDHLGWFAHVQCWNHDEDPDATWEYGLVLCCRENAWVPRLVYDWGTKLPTFTEVADYVDKYVYGPEALRFLLR